ncbi:DNA-processing protein DprA [bacterium]|nr:DNA-processing protein DprA [candidate division CSSED10-310 bacterium]
MEQSDRRKWLALSLWPGFGVKSWLKLNRMTDNPVAIFDDRTLQARFTDGRRSTEDFGKLLDMADAELARAQTESFGIITVQDPQFSHLLRSIPDPPPVLFYRGDISFLDTLSMGIVGTRHPTAYGIEMTRKFATGLSKRNITIVSGLAIGIDAHAHDAALRQSGKTVAVLGCGLDQDYPRSNRELRCRIEHEGLVVSEYPWGTAPNPGQFPRRNRIISGLSWGTLIVEARESSGALITANLALEQNREVFALPGNITSAASRGPLSLIRQGAVPVTEIDDILEHLPGRPGRDTSNTNHLPDLQPPENLTDSEKILWSCLSCDAESVDDLIVKSGLPASQVHSILLKFELSGRVQQLPGKQYKFNSKSSN